MSRPAAWIHRACRSPRSTTARPPTRPASSRATCMTTLDGRWTASIADVFAAAADAEPGRAADVVILRDGKEMTLSVTPAEGA